MLRSKHCRSQDIEKSVHLRSYFVTKLADWMMQPGGEFHRELNRPAAHKGMRDQRRSWESVSRHSAGAQFVTECRDLFVGDVPGNQFNGLLCCLRRRFPKNRQLTH